MHRESSPGVSMLGEPEEPRRRNFTRLVFTLIALGLVGGGIAATVVLTQSPAVTSFAQGPSAIGKISSNATALNADKPMAVTNTATVAPTTRTVARTTTTNPPVLVGLGRILTKDIFLEAFPTANPLYKYENLIAMADKYPEFANTGNLVADRREVAAFLGHVSLESGELRFVEEINKSVMCEASVLFPCAAGKQYYGRGPMQLSWNYNYKEFGRVAGVDLVQNPELVATDPLLLWWSALWYSNADKWNGNIHKVINKPGGFAYVTFMINGGMECGVNPPNRKSEKSRIESYVKFCNVLGVDPGDNLSCQTAAFPPKNLWTSLPATTKRP